MYQVAVANSMRFTVSFRAQSWRRDDLRYAACALLAAHRRPRRLLFQGQKSPGGM